jgi:transposase
MYFLGIDVSKSKSDYCLIDDNQNIIKTFSNQNSRAGLEKTLKEIFSASKSTTTFSLALEATGIFWQPVYYFFKESGFNIILLNPYSVKHFSQMRLSKTKTDKMDSYQIACSLESGYSKKSIIPEDKIISLRDVVRTKSYLLKQICSLKRKILTTLTSSFTEYQSVFPKPFSITSLTILKLYPSAFALAKLIPDDLIKIFRSIKGNNNCDLKANNIINTAKNSITPKDGISGKQISITNLVILYEALNKQYDELQNQIELLLNDFESSLESLDADKTELNPIQAVLTIPGVGIKTIAVIIASCGDLTIFKTSTAFIGYIGLYPQQYQSGKTNKFYSHKKCIPIVKKQLYCASVACLKHNIEFRQIYLDALSKGFSKKQALCKVSYKLAKIIWRLYNHKCKYCPNFVFTNKIRA